MILTGASMTNRKYLLGLFSIFFIITIFANEKQNLWDFGVIIKTSSQQNTSKMSTKTLSNVIINPHPQVEALIANPFIPPTLTTFKEKVFIAQNTSASWGEIPLEDINQVKLLAGQLTMQVNYLPIIEMLKQINFSILDESDCLDLNYWLANAFLNTGKYTEAEDLILASLTSSINDRFHFLLAMTYEAQGKIKEAQKEYLIFIKQFPNSDYQVTALIKARMLDRR